MNVANLCYLFVSAELENNIFHQLQTYLWSRITTTDDLTKMRLEAPTNDATAHSSCDLLTLLDTRESKNGWTGRDPSALIEGFATQGKKTHAHMCNNFNLFIYLFNRNWSFTKKNGCKFRAMKK